MNIERLFKIILMDLTSDNLKLDAELEATINNPNMNTDVKVQNIKSLLAKIVAVEGSIKKFTDILQKTNASNNNIQQSKTEENGKD